MKFSNSHIKSQTDFIIMKNRVSLDYNIKIIMTSFHFFFLQKNMSFDCRSKISIITFSLSDISCPNTCLKIIIVGFFKKNLVIQAVFNSNNVIVETVCKH